MLQVDERINPRWVIAVLKERGLRAPDTEVLARTVAALNAGERSDFRAKVAAMHRGVEAPGILDWMAAWVDNLPAPQAAPAPATAVPVQPVPRKEAEPAQASGHAVRPSAQTSRQGHPLERSHHVYGGKAALCVEVVEVAGDESGRGGYSTVLLEFAPATGDGKHYAWEERKVQFRLGLRELPRVAAVLLGYADSVELDGHGPTHNKSLWIEDQGGAIFFKVRMGRAAHGVPLTAGDLYEVSARVMHALSRNAPGLDGQVALALVRRAGHMHLAERQARSDKGL